METETTYTPPAALEIVDDDAIHERMLSVIPDTLDKTDGGFVYDFTRPAALEKAEMMVLLNEAIQVFFPDFSYSGFLDKIAAQDGLTRRAATSAEGYVTITGVTGTTIPKGFLFSTPATQISGGIEFAATESKTIPAEGTVQVPVKCISTGVDGNVSPGSITLMASPISGIESINNASTLSGGTPEETDDSLRQRVKESDAQGSSSFVGNDADYKRWAQEVDGVGDVVVVPEWEGAGTGTVKLIVMDATGSPANQTMLDAVYDHIMSDDDRDHRLAPIGAILTVVTAGPVSISVSASIVLDEDADILSVTTAFRTALQAYFAEAKTENAVRYTRVASVLSETVGVLDYSTLLLNGGTENVTITVNDYPTIGTITFIEAV